MFKYINISSINQIIFQFNIYLKDNTLSISLLFIQNQLQI